MKNYTPDFGDGIRYEELADVTVDEYLTQGVKLVWIIITDTREAMVCTKENKYVVSDKLTAPELLPDFELPIEAIFAGLEK